MRNPAFTAFIGPGHKRHAFYRRMDDGKLWHLAVACGMDVGDRIINHDEPYSGDNPALAVSCAKCRTIIERVTNGVTPDHLRAVLA